MNQIVVIETVTWERKIKIKLTILYQSCTTSNTVRVGHCLNYYEKLTNSFFVSRDMVTRYHLEEVKLENVEK